MRIEEESENYYYYNRTTLNGTSYIQKIKKNNINNNKRGRKMLIISKETEDKICNMYINNLKRTDISNELNLSIYQVRKVLKKRITPEMLKMIDNFRL